MSKVGIVYADIGGEKRPMLFGVNASIRLGEEYGIQLEEIEKRINSGALPVLRSFVFVSLQDGARRNGVEFTDDIETVGDWLDDYIVENGMESVTDLITKSMVFMQASSRETAEARPVVQD